jgi:septal ring factor EnvC (AmiA/AmiB activator)
MKNGAFFLLCITGILYAKIPQFTQAKSQIQQLNLQINSLKQKLTHTQDKRVVVTKKLKGTEQQISKAVTQLEIIQSNILANQKKIQLLQKDIDFLNERFKKQQKQLAQYVKARYAMGTYQPVKWIINQNNPHSFNRLLSFHQYILESRKQILNNIEDTKNKISLKKEKINKELQDNQILEQQLFAHQHSLEENKKMQKNVILSLEHTIQSQEKNLSEFEKNKKYLSSLLQSLALKSTNKNQQSFNKVRHKLPKPVLVQQKDIHKMNQGVTFFAKEGTPVHAVHAGKVVFSDWLNGYGFLLILDHGEGFMTLYAHNQSLLKPKGTVIAQNEPIATVGHSGSLKQNGLYFEIRKNGKTVPPTKWI